jgi:hypothetical protein
MYPTDVSDAGHEVAPIHWHDIDHRVDGLCFVLSLMLALFATLAMHFVL